MSETTPGHESDEQSQQPGQIAVVIGDPLLDVRTELETVEELPVAERAEVFERAHRVVVEELRQHELG